MVKWKITKDLISNGENEGTCSKKGEPNPEKSVKFRIKDDDEEIYYYGLCEDSSSFEPLDDFAMPNDGCTIIEYFENGKWEIL